MNNLITTERLRRTRTIALTTWNALWMGAGPIQAGVETVTLALIVTSALVLLASTHAISTLEAIPPMVLLDGPGCALWLTFRLRMRQNRWLLNWLADAAIGLPVIVALEVIAAAGLLLMAPLTYQLSQLLALRVELHGAYPYLIAMLIGLYVAYLVPRSALRVWLFWQRLGRKQLRWALTNASLTAAALAAVVFITLFATLLLTASGRNYASVLFVVLFLLFLTALGLAFMAPPSIAFWYLFARGITNRLQTLTSATGALRAGDYSVRTPVVGEDEIAQLQANFNAMAADLERAMRDLQAERDNVATLLRARRELVASVSHELRTPVATVLGYLESTRLHWDDAVDGAPPPTLRHDLDVVERETVRLQLLIDDLFALSRAEVGRLELHLAPTDVAETTRHVVETVAPLAWRANRVEVVAYTPPTNLAAPVALVDANRLQQILRNLLQNSVRHTQPGGIVAASVDALDADTITLQVSDTGEGITPSDLPHIWDRFYQGTSAQGAGGAGLGLALVKELTETMGGAVSVQSVPGEGSRFTITLPRVVAPADGACESRTSSPRHVAPAPPVAVDAEPLATR